MAKQSKPYKEGKTWSMRRRVLGQDLYVSGKDTKTEAAEAMKALVDPLMQRGRPAGDLSTPPSRRRCRTTAWSACVSSKAPSRTPIA